MECIVLAGGLGTRLSSSIGALPKCMAPINNQPFLYYIFQQLKLQGCCKVVLSLGYLSEVIIDWIKEVDFPFEINYVVEQQPLGTGGGINLSLSACHNDDVIIVNGDTYFDVDFTSLMHYHQSRNAATTLALKPMDNYDRYGTVVTDEQGRILSFEEKKLTPRGLINGGIYVINKSTFTKKKFSEKFSFEKEYLEAYVGEQQFYGKSYNNYFIDIGIPSDYQKAQEDFRTLFV